ncbi:hypothetical protein OBBRIDRAFT_833483 [Obba rivulosa]|uniref:Uncharacterized protein n=1 Tax=Obba rivulosa TaxID=1052685 RepID=A0A8E2B094_9APHY|nr:hypothetical protein OBBRIDRAFT_833483 [Obba rivulosa]
MIFATICLPYNVDPIFALVPKSLRHLDITFNPIRVSNRTRVRSLPSLEPLVRGLHTVTPAVQRLRINAYFETSTIATVQELGNLQAFCLTCSGPAQIFERSTLAALSRVRNLIQLELRVRLDDDPSGPLLTFPLLQHLILRGHSSHLADVLAAISAPSLTKLVISEATCFSTTECQEVLRVVVERFGSSLRIMQFEMSLMNNGADEVLNVIEPLLNLHDIQEVHLYLMFWKSLRFADDDVRRLAQAWTRIRRLIMSYGTTFPALPTFHALEYFARYCPDLTYVILPVLDLSPCGCDADVPSFDHGLKFLNVKRVAHARANEEIYAAARSIHRVFRYLDPSTYIRRNASRDHWSRIMVRYIEIQEDESVGSTPKP